MKRTLAIFLMLIMILSVALISCKDKTTGTQGGVSGDLDDDGGLVADGTGNGTTDGKDDGKDDGTGDGSDDTEEEWVVYTTPKTLYSMVDELRVRSSMNYNGDGNIIKKINTGDSVTASAKSTDTEAWYKITLDGQEAYVLAEFLTEVEADTKFADVERETLTIKPETSSSTYKTNLRTSPAFGNTTKFITIENEDTAAGQLVKVAVNESGNIWKVEYTATGETAPKTYYIGNKAFGNFVGYSESAGGLG
jgi:uncharacterized protein YgiM (DUF1202 family)